MGKTNFTKVEEALREGLDKLQRDKLLQQADEAQLKHKTKKTTDNQLVEVIRRDLNQIKKKDKKFLKELGFTKNEIKALLDKEGDHSLEELKQLGSLEEKIAAYKQALKSRRVQEPDDEIVEREKKHHINKRFNVNDDWLPLQ